MVVEEREVSREPQSVVLSVGLPVLPRVRSVPHHPPPDLLEEPEHDDDQLVYDHDVPLQHRYRRPVAHRLPEGDVPVDGPRLQMLKVQDTRYMA